MSHPAISSEPTETVVLVDESDREVGTMEKLEAHRRGVLHRAVSVVIFDRSGRMLLQRRAASKYHSPGLWANSCCSHPRVGESPLAAARRRLREEMGMTCELRPAFAFCYDEDVGAGLRENEYDHVFVGASDAAPDPNPAEVDAWRFVDEPTLRDELARSPERFTPWFRILVRHLAAVAGDAPWADVALHIT